MKWSEGQQQALDVFDRGENLFVTGPGGSGKTTLIREMYSRGERRVQVTALTGCAAVLIGCKARTLHSFAGIGLGMGTVEENVARVMSSSKKARVWRSVDVLIIDEVSMMSKKLMEIVDAVARACRRTPKIPFGGLQMIFSGDFYQIRPIGNEDFCFESPLWSELFPSSNQISLAKIFRQSDATYAAVLNRVRDGTMDKASIELLQTRVGKTCDRSFRPTKLVATRRQAEDMNRREMEALPSEEEHVYELCEICDPPADPKDTATTNELTFLKRGIMCEDTIRLRRGCQVMCVVNKQRMDTKPICNGSQGVVIGFVDDLPIVRFQNGVETMMEPHTWSSETVPGVGVRQMPLILAWAITIHKAQGASMDSAEIDAGSSIFECGQTYVALSRIRTIEGLFLTSFDPASVYVNPRVREFYARLSK
jgi:ATP-dependent DNA helicase PIF1